MEKNTVNFLWRYLIVSLLTAVSMTVVAADSATIDWNDPEVRRQAVIETAYAYYLKADCVQYDSAPLIAGVKSAVVPVRAMTITIGAETSFASGSSGIWSCICRMPQAPTLPSRSALIQKRRTVPRASSQRMRSNGAVTTLQAATFCRSPLGITPV